ncbi:hypothetical protein [Granulimonas faecalis]|uniref:hypothetical protein n=1 Tax=Granulimonas faecalis TaxID=2894155 RepID=UPI0035110521
MTVQTDAATKETFARFANLKGDAMSLVMDVSELVNELDPVGIDVPEGEPGHVEHWSRLLSARDRVCTSIECFARSVLVLAYEVDLELMRAGMNADEVGVVAKVDDSESVTVNNSFIARTDDGEFIEITEETRIKPIEVVDADDVRSTVDDLKRAAKAAHATSEE